MCCVSLELKPIMVDCYENLVSNSDTQTRGGLPLYCCIWKITRYRNLLAPLKVSRSDTRTMATCWGGEVNSPPVTGHGPFSGHQLTAGHSLCTN